MSIIRVLADIETRKAFFWLIKPKSRQAEMLEDWMRHYNDPVYDIHDVSMQLMGALDSPISDYDGNYSRILFTILATAIIEYAITKKWDVVVER